MKFTIQFERVITHTVEIEVEADSEEEADAQGEQLVDLLDSIYVKTDDEPDWIRIAMLELTGGWELEDEQYQLLAVHEGGL